MARDDKHHSAHALERGPDDVKRGVHKLRTPIRSPSTDAPVSHPGSTAAGPRVPLMMEQALAYQVDWWQRAILFLDTLRERANNLFAHDRAGMPVLLDFDYELVLDARRFDPPANYALLRVTRCSEHVASTYADADKPPVMILDPRAGHGPGIGGFKHDSEVGMALCAGHPTYFVIFFPHPCPGQKLGDVLKAFRRFVEAVSASHGGVPPVLYGNCQAGWAAMLLAADCQGLSGPVVLNGSPLSYWAGAAGVNPTRLSAGLLGGTWVTHFLADLGDGELDGAWLVAGFENLNPGNTLWDKNDKLFANVDTERERFLEFERWWTGFHFLSRDEILFILENLFVGNKLERGQLRLDDCCIVDLKRVRSPLVIFASSGDNITPPHQALNWIPVTYPTTADLKAAGQRIVYLLNEHVGHLGIFVSADVAKREHRAILRSLRAIEALPPGLYQMILEPAQSGAGAMKVQFVEREVSDIRFAYPQTSFRAVQALSEQNEAVYTALVSPWVRAVANPLLADALKWLHPMRSSRYLFSELVSPAMLGVGVLAQLVRMARAPAQPANLFVNGERAASELVSKALRQYQEYRDAASEDWFVALFGTPDVPLESQDSEAAAPCCAGKAQPCDAHCATRSAPGAEHTRRSAGRRPARKERTSHVRGAAQSH